MATAFDDLEHRIKALPDTARVQIAVALATLAEPLASVSLESQPTGGIAAVAARIRAPTSLADLEDARHALWSTLGEETDEPDGAAWFSHGVTVAWIYAADSKLSAPSAGAINALRRVLDLLDSVDDTLGDTSFVDDLLLDLGDVADVALILERLGNQAVATAAAAHRLRPLS